MLVPPLTILRGGGRVESGAIEMAFTSSLTRVVLGIWLAWDGQRLRSKVELELATMARWLLGKAMISSGTCVLDISKSV
jgi:hypothetical protein